MNFRANGSKCQYARWLVYVSAFGTGYTARMRQIIVAVVFVVIALWLGIYVVPDLIANMLPGEP
jgi:disulfide bond formation protein DsbB